MDKLALNNNPQAQAGISQHKGNYYDLNELNKLRSAAPDDKSALRAAAKQFESIFTQMLLSSMRKASDVLESDSPFNSQSSKFYRDMQDKQMVMDLADNGGLGLTDIIVEQLSGTSESYKPSSIVRPDANLDGMGRNLDSNRSSNGINKAEQIGQPKDVEQAKESKSQLFDSPKAFVESLLPVAEKALKGTPLEPMMVVAQAALETGWGKKIMNKGDGSSSFNLFGIKADNRWQGEKANVQTLEFRGGVAQKEQANFRAYGSLEESIKDYANFVTKSDRYSEAVKNADNAPKYFDSLQKAGYATDPQYANKVLGILKGEHFNETAKNPMTGPVQ